ncbi:DeoR/GlpR family DNA-binding transcription regulator [Nocardioides panacisoli]|uniref:DeoR/GlpR family DNA-binding transcription regulator n=1 Tax=Nocardioides panacisoli TaxID=627624 RepID=UPI001C635CB5|nr:DeoR/GlpR family DNA-binding transcription regulator [Nocardioides panacisoli]QYJ03185.1 DeoR/GlpR family DNA-binding transcription regulator [Nocardioides panacisoli]
MGTVRAGTRARHAELLRLLGEGLTSVDDLARAAGVSPSTVRRDLARLREQGAVARTYGGAMVAPPFHERPIGDSARHRTDAKAAIARRAGELLTPQGSVFLDAGTTCAALARLIAADDSLGPLTVVTRGLETAVVLADSAHVDVHLLGGRLRRLSHGLVGPAASLTLERMAFDVAFLGADAVDPERGIGEPTLDETVLKEQVARVAQRCVVVADATKWGATAPSWTAMPGPWTWVTDAAVGAGTGAGTDCEVVRA